MHTDVWTEAQWDPNLWPLRFGNSLRRESEHGQGVYWRYLVDSRSCLHQVLMVMCIRLTNKQNTLKPFNRNHSATLQLNNLYHVPSYEYMRWICGVISVVCNEFQPIFGMFHLPRTSLRYPKIQMPPSCAYPLRPLSQKSYHYVDVCQTKISPVKYLNWSKSGRNNAYIPTLELFFPTEQATFKWPQPRMKQQLYFQQRCASIQGAPAPRSPTTWRRRQCVLENQLPDMKPDEGLTRFSFDNPR